MTRAAAVRSPDERQLLRLLRWQALIAGAVLVSVSPFGIAPILSAAIGAGICLIANWLFALWVFRRYCATQPGALLARFYGAEVVKIGLVLAALTLAFATLDGLHPPALLGAYFAVQTLPAFLASRPPANATTEKR